MQALADSLCHDPLLEKTSRVLQAIQSIPSLRHVPILERADQELDPALASCLKRELSDVPEESAARINDELFAFGPIERIARDPRITEILVLAPDRIWIERDGQLKPAADRFLNDITYRNFLARLHRATRSRTDFEQPFCDGRWGDFRVHLGIEPVVHGGAQVCLRRIRSNPWRLATLLECEWATASAIDCLRELIHSRQNILFIGGTGSGKTSALGACLKEIAANERVVLLEDTDELALPNTASTKLLTRKSTHAADREWDLGDLLRQALRMRPDRLVMGEVRGPEAKDLLMAFATGHRGCFGTLHATTPREALLRLEMLIQMGAPQWSTATVRALIHSGIDAIVSIQRDSDGKRRLDSIHRVASLEDIGFCFSSLYARTSMKLPRG